MNRNLLFFLAVVFVCYSLSIINSGCAQIGMPTGGDKDTLAPVLIRSSPEIKATNIKDNKITLTFNEYVEVADAQTNVLVSPVQKNYTEVRYTLKTVTVKLKDSLLPNTTYSINFGNSIKDVNEGNIFKEFTYVFSTGNTIDSLEYSGKVLLAETGKADSLLKVILYRSIDDSAVLKTRPDYLARVNADGTFNFKYLPAGKFRIYALKDGDGNKSYNSKTEMFAFTENNEPITVGNDTTEKITLFAYEEEKPKPVSIGKSDPGKPKIETKFRYTAQPGKQDLLTPLVVTFNNPVTIDSQKIYISDTNYNRLPATLTLDSTKKILSVGAKWLPETNYILMIEKDAAKDSLNNSNAKNDTIRFISKRMEDYGRITLRFTGLQLSMHPILQMMEGETVKYSYPLTNNEWSNRQFPPGEYGIRILYDTNNNGQWDPGNFSKNLQPEKTIPISQKLAIKADWDNEREIKL